MLMWISGLQKVLLGRFLGPKFGDLGVQFGDLRAQIEVPEGPQPPRNPPEPPQGSQQGCISLSRLIRATRVTQLDKSSNERTKNQRIDLWMRRGWSIQDLDTPLARGQANLCSTCIIPQTKEARLGWGSYLPYIELPLSVRISRRGLLA